MELLNYECKVLLSLTTGLVVMGGDSSSRSLDFESQYRMILGGKDIK